MSTSDEKLPEAKFGGSHQIYSNDSLEIISTVHTDKNKIRKNINFGPSPIISQIQLVITVHNRSAYYIRPSSAVQTHVSQTSFCLLDQKAQPILISGRSIPNHWPPLIENTSSALPISATKDLIPALKQLKRHVMIADLLVRSRLLVAGTLAVSILLGTEFINEHVLGIHLNVLKVVPRSSRSIAIFFLWSKMVNSTVTTDNYHSVQVTARHANDKVVKQVRLKPRSISPVTVVSTARVCLRFEPYMALVQRQMLPANGNMQAIPNIVFWILLTNMSSQHDNLLKHMILGRLRSNFTAVVDLNQLFLN